MSVLNFPLRHHSCGKIWRLDGSTLSRPKALPKPVDLPFWTAASDDAVSSSSPELSRARRGGPGEKRIFQHTTGVQPTQFLQNGHVYSKDLQGSFENASLYLPPREIQLQTVAGANVLGNLTTTIRELEQELWQKPKSIGRLQTAIKGFEGVGRCVRPMLKTVATFAQASFRKSPRGR